MVTFKCVRGLQDSEYTQHKHNACSSYPADSSHNPRGELLTNQIKNKYDKVYIVPLDKLTKQELLELCESLQKKASSSMVKSEIIDLLNGEDNDD
ncbi:hypothetical protein [Klebsiella pneumoniae]|uniref:hypothetical protein n=1 Tax=Klebsiella pneumoniae TaxID=573 RepID=UPI00146A2180|nr:hypothetical protein [Klebsiella pneumoniae]NMV05521.1 hypothetical protein [Klebsiella pneumoniae]